MDHRRRPLHLLDGNRFQQGVAGLFLEQQHVVSFIQLKQARSQERRPGKIERLRGLAVRHRTHQAFPFFARKLPAQRLHDKDIGNVVFRPNDLPGVAPRIDEGRAEDLVPADETAQGVRKRAYIKLAAQP